MSSEDCYVLYTHDYSGETSCSVFLKEVDAQKEMENDVKNVLEILKEDGYECNTSIRMGDASVYVPDTDIYYEWEIFESDIVH